MTDMDSQRRNFFTKVFALAMLFASLASTAQEAGDTDSIGPAVDTSVEQQVGRDELEPAAPSAIIAADVTRRERGNQVMDELELDRTEVTGNQELPKVLYIVPWKKADPGDLMGRPVNSLLDEVLAPLDREEFVRQVGYYDELYRDENE
jgi:hypothetical protein